MSGMSEDFDQNWWEELIKTGTGLLGEPNFNNQELEAWPPVDEPQSASTPWDAIDPRLLDMQPLDLLADTYFSDLEAGVWPAVDNSQPSLAQYFLTTVLGSRP